ncbi:MAG TPA: hypothetical protein VGP93_16670, partial [Polyangiaceae bacterium]|nr:hypothetical protein [Polyangiaceae bacterium]
MSARKARSESPAASDEAPLSIESFARNLTIATACKLFDDVGVAASLCSEGHWASIHTRPNVVTFEFEHGLLTERFAYNDRCLERVQREKETVVAEHAGFVDLFVPIRRAQEVSAFLVTGPLLSARPTGAEILERWRWLTGTQGDPVDPEFSRYVELTLSTLVLDSAKLTEFRKFVERIAGFLAGRGPVSSVRQLTDSMGAQFGAFRRVERIWGAAREMVDERTGRNWSSPHLLVQRESLGLAQCPEHAVVGLFVSLRETDPVEALLQRHAFQRACVELAQSAENTISGRIGDYGVFFLSAESQKADRTRRRLLDLARKAAAVAAERFGFRMHLGTSSLTGPLPVQYQAALAAAQAALSCNEPVVSVTPDAPRARPLGKLRHELAELAEAQPGALPARFDRFIEAVAVR